MLMLTWKDQHLYKSVIYRRHFVREGDNVRCCVDGGFLVEVLGPQCRFYHVVVVHTWNRVRLSPGRRMSWWFRDSHMGAASHFVFHALLEARRCSVTLSSG